MDTSSQTPQQPSVPWDMLDRYLAGESSAEETALVTAYLAQHPSATLLLKQPAKLWSQRQVQTLNTERLWRNLEETAQKDHAVPRRGLPALGKKWPRAIVVGVICATFAVLLALVGPVIRGIREHLAAVSPGGEPSTVYATRNGQRAEITLPDGSHVTLDVASQLSVPADFSSGHRTVQLRGEALFTVNHHGTSPFTVVSGQDITRVLGTTFLVRNYTTDSATTVAVREGKVSVDNTIVTGREQAVISRTHVPQVRPATAAQFTFASGILTFDGISLRDAIPELNRWYDADIQLADPTLANAVAQGAFPSGSLNDLTTILQFTFNARVVRHGHQLTLYANAK